MSAAQIGQNALSSGDAGSLVNIASAQYGAALLSYSSLSASADQWGNVKIPWLEDLPVHLPSDHQQIM